MLKEFKVGDKVMLDLDFCSSYDLEEFGSNGGFNVVYTVEEVDSSYVKFKGSNWHKKRWLKYAKKNNKVGGTLNNKQSMVSKVITKIKRGK